MAQDQLVRYRTVLEVAVISLVIYYFLGTPGLSTSPSLIPSPSKQTPEEDVPEAKAKIESLVSPDPNLQCASHQFKDVHIYSTAPLVVYIDGFLSESEADHMIEISCVRPLHCVCMRVETVPLTEVQLGQMAALHSLQPRHRRKR